MLHLVNLKHAFSSRRRNQPVSNGDTRADSHFMGYLGKTPEDKWQEVQDFMFLLYSCLQFIWSKIFLFFSFYWLPFENAHADNPWDSKSDCYTLEVCLMVVHQIEISPDSCICHPCMPLWNHLICLKMLFCFTYCWPGTVALATQMPPEYVTSALRKI